jgi:hypothetical protein
MIQRTHRVFLLVFCLASICGLASAQTVKTVTLRMLDGKTGLLISTSNFLVSINHQQDIHGDWVQKNEDGTGKLTLPANADEISIHATYENAMLIYANCDVDKDRASADHAAAPDRWYSVATILEKGFVAPNACIGKKIPDKLQVLAKPGEFVFFVRPLNSMERMRE